MRCRLCGDIHSQRVNYCRKVKFLFFAEMCLLFLSDFKEAEVNLLLFFIFKALNKRKNKISQRDEILVKRVFNEREERLQLNL